MKNTILNISKIAAAVLLAAGTATSCLEKYPGSYIPEEDAMKTFQDAEQHVVGIYASLKSSSLYSGYLTLLPDIQADLVMATLTNSNPYAGIWEWDIRPTNTQIEAVYGSLYSVIGNCNFYLEKINDVIAAETDDDNLELLDTYTGEVYAIRALCYSELIKCFCEAYPSVDSDGNTPDDEAARNMLGVVLRTKYTEPEPVRRASLYDSYQLVISDLSRAEELLDDGDDDPTANEGDEYDNYYISPATVYAIRARVALYIGEKEEAARLAESLINDARYGLDSYDRIFRGAQNTEIIFAFSCLTSDQSKITLSSYFYSYNHPNSGSYVYAPAGDVMTMYTDGDNRKDISITTLDNLDFINKYPSGQTGTDPVIISRLGEMYLISAEAQGLEDGIGRLNELRSFRGLDPVYPATESKYLDAILEERRKELLCEGHRWYDLVRTGKAVETLGIQQYQTLLPIPAEERMVNENLSQNPGY